MTFNLAPLNNATFDARHETIFLTQGHGLTVGGNVYTVTATPVGLSTYDTWTGGPAITAPDPSDTIKYSFKVQDAALGIVSYTYTTGDNVVHPSVGAAAAVIRAVNSTGYLFEQLLGYVPGQTQINPDGQFIALSSADVSFKEQGYAGPPAAALSFVACFAAGTRIACGAHEAAVETLRVGQRVALAEGGTAPIVWIGQRHIDCRAHPAPETVWPVRVAPGAFGPEVPARPLFLSPDHAVFTDGVLIPIRLLVNGDTIRQVERPAVTYYHIELERHAVLLAEGLPVESYLGGGDRSGFADAQARGRPATSWECEACAPLVLTGERLLAARRRLAVREDARNILAMVA